MLLCWSFFHKDAKFQDLSNLLNWKLCYRTQLAMPVPGLQCANWTGNYGSWGLWFFLASYILNWGAKLALICSSHIVSYTAFTMGGLKKTVYDHFIMIYLVFMQLIYRYGLSWIFAWFKVHLSSHYLWWCLIYKGYYMLISNRFTFIFVLGAVIVFFSQD